MDFWYKLMAFMDFVFVLIEVGMIEKTSSFQIRTKITFGRGSLSSLGQVAKEMGVERYLSWPTRPSINLEFCIQQSRA